MQREVSKRLENRIVYDLILPSINLTSIVTVLQLSGVIKERAAPLGLIILSVIVVVSPETTLPDSIEAMLVTLTETLVLSTVIKSKNLDAMGMVLWISTNLRKKNLLSDIISSQMIRMKLRVLDIGMVFGVNCLAIRKGNKRLLFS